VPGAEGEIRNLGKKNLPTKLPPDLPTLVEILGGRGYRSAAIGAVWNAHLSLPGRFPEMQMIEKPAPKLVRRAVGWMKAQDGKPVFLWLHLGDAHEPLDVRRDLAGVFGEIPKLPKVRQWAYTFRTDPYGSPEFERYREARVRMYDAAVRSVDASLRDLWEQLEAMGERDRTVMVVTSDHGEEFWEHRDDELAFADPRDIAGTGHGHNLFQVHTLIPLVVVGAGIESRTVEANVSLADVFPTVLQAAGVDPPGGGDGCSLLEDHDPNRPVLSHGIAYGYEKHAVVRGDLKLLQSPGDGYERVFRLGPDRREGEAVPSPSPEDLAGLRSAIPGGPSAEGEQIEATDEIVDHLRDLGYIE